MWFQPLFQKLDPPDWIATVLALFLSVADHVMKVVDWMRPPATAGSPTQISYSLTDHRPGAMLTHLTHYYTPCCAFIFNRDGSLSSLPIRHYVPLHASLPTPEQVPSRPQIPIALRQMRRTVVPSRRGGGGGEIGQNNDKWWGKSMPPLIRVVSPCAACAC